MQKGMPKQYRRQRVENVPRININQLRVPRDWQVHSMMWPSFQWPFIIALKISWNEIVVTYKGNPYPTRFALKLVKTGMNKYFRHHFICRECRRPVGALFHYRERLACRHCHDLVYACSMK
jgi:hypothetical protein